MADSAAAARPRVTDSALTRVEPAWVWLVAIVGVSTIVRYALGRRIVAPWIMVDELVYSELAKSFAEAGRFLIRGESAAAYGFVYPVLIAPAFALFDSIPDAYAVAKAINALVMSLAAVPAYFLARRVVSPMVALAAAALTLAVPSLVYTGTLMTENAFYPLFLCLAVALTAYLDRPTAIRVLVLLGLCGLAFLTRAQAVAFVPAIATAPLLVAWTEKRGLRDLRPYRLLYAVLGGGLVALLGLQLARGRSPADLLGAYAPTADHPYEAPEIARWLLWHVAELDLYLGVIPLAAFIVLAVRARSLDRPLRIHVAATVSLSVWLVLEVAAFASIPSVARIEERNLFYVAPLFLVALLAWLERGALRPRRVAVAAALVAGLLPAAIPYERFIGLSATSDTLALMPLWRLQDNLIDLDQVRLLVGAAGLAAAAAWLFVSTRWGAVLPALVAAWFLAIQGPAQDAVHGFRFASANGLFGGIGTAHVDWIDRAVEGDAVVAAVWSGNVDRHVIWENEFFNRSVGPVYRLGDTLGGGLPEVPVRIERKTGLLRDGEGGVVRSQFALVDGSIEPNGTVVAADARRGVAVYRLSGPLRSMTRVTGIYASDTWSGPWVTYVRQQCHGGHLTVLLHSDASLFRRPSRVIAYDGARVVASTRVSPTTRGKLFRVPLRGDGQCRIVFGVSPMVVAGGGDPRPLGLHFSAFRFAAA